MSKGCNCSYRCVRGHFSRSEPLVYNTNRFPLKIKHIGAKWYSLQPTDIQGRDKQRCGEESCIGNCERQPSFSWGHWSIAVPKHLIPCANPVFSICRYWPEITGKAEKRAMTATCNSCGEPCSGNGLLGGNKTCRIPYERDSLTVT